jgi:hypothetical protein
MTYPSFSAGEVLRAADMNAVGLWLVKSQTVGTGVSSVTVTGAFSADYENYKIIYSGGTQSADASHALRLGGSTTGYNTVLFYTDSATPPITIPPAVQNGANLSAWIGGGSAGQAAHAEFELLGPNLAAYTKIRNGLYQDGTNYGTMQGEHRVATAYTSFELLAGTGTITGGTIRVYGYRN